MFLAGPPNRAFHRTLSQVVETVETHFIITETELRGEGLAHDRDLAKLPHPQWVPQSMQQYGGDVNGLVLHWCSKEGQPSAQGGFDFYSLDEIYNFNGEGFFYLDAQASPKEARMSTFKPVDFFVGEACVGLFYDEKAESELYLYTFEDIPQPTGLDIAGYIRLMSLSLGFNYWQLLLVELARPNSPRPYTPARDENRIADLLDFVDNMPILYPEFSLDAFVALYDQVRLPR